MKLPIDNKMYGFGEQRNDNRWLMVALLAFALLWKYTPFHVILVLVKVGANIVILFEMTKKIRRFSCSLGKSFVL